jgi:hypothetical protein
MATIIPAVAVCQVVLHVLLSESYPAPMTAQAVNGHAMPDPHDGSPMLAMLLMHAVAVLITSWWLERGESALCGLVHRLAVWALRVFARLWPEPVHGPAQVAPVVWSRRVLPAAVLRHVLVLRGPPTGFLTLG